MRRPFVRVYLWVSLAVLIVSTLSAMHTRRELTHEVERRIEAALAPGVHIARDRLRGGPARHDATRRRPRARPTEAVREQFLTTLSDAWGVDVATAPAGEVRLHDRDERRVRSGEVVYAHAPELGPIIVAAMAPGEWLIMGPLPNPPGRGLVVGTLLRVSLTLTLIGGVLFLVLGPYERRLQRLAEAAAALGDGRWVTRVEDTQRDAIGDVGRAFDSMAGRIETVVERQRELFAGVSHELRTPLARLLFLLEELEDSDDAGARARHVARASASVDEINALVAELLALARADASPPELQRVDLREAVERALEAVPALDGLKVTTEGDASAMADTELTHRSLTNVLSNAARYAESEVAVTIADQPRGPMILIDDDGPGIPARDRERVFEAFTQLDASRGQRGAAGLGLAIVARSMAAQGGAASASETSLGGVRITLAFASPP